MMTLLEQVLQAKQRNVGICETCKHLIDFGSENGFICEKHDKFILAMFPPYHDHVKCKDWKGDENENN